MQEKAVTAQSPTLQNSAGMLQYGGVSVGFAEQRRSAMIVQLVVASGNRMGQVVPILEEKFIIGRAEDCHLKPQSELISRYHCAILVGNNVVVRDLGSKNGVRLNGKKINAEQLLNDGDKLTIGPLEFYLHIADDADASAKLPTSGAAGSDVSWYQSDDRDDSRIGPADPTVLLNHLKLLNQEVSPEQEQSESNPLKKLL